LIFISDWIADYYDPHNFFVEAGWNRHIGQEFLFGPPENVELIKKARMVLNLEERISLYQRADRIIVKEAPIIPIRYHRNEGFQQQWLKGLAFNPTVSASFKDVIIEEH
jgi:ABC-type oligopeptide transport system substrate-binding subunit